MLQKLAVKRGVAPIQPGSDSSGPEPFVGQYVLRDDFHGDVALTPVAIDCPYCSTPMQQSTVPHAIAKVVAVGPAFADLRGPRCEIGVIDLPADRQLLWCAHCLQAFTVPIP